MCLVARPDVDLQRIFCYRLERRVSRARTVSVGGRLYETDAALAGHKVVLLQDPAGPPEQALIVLHEHREAGRATLLDLHANARIRRHSPPAAEPPPAASRAPGKASRDPSATPASPPPGRPLALRQLRPEPPDPETD